ncbi:MULTISPECIES: zinc-dependent alcohol dehydrogenase [Paenibacillus]|uniref:zinc-dependent alcohol dehydrogenase n=1 Tax=Paenibacillus TaxID=44249 RepID=UPI0022B916DC|nr:zinc-binding alcohol dehydrogenase [Paenibacillus caseinilyticus]MCZ8520440.1 zinc-binding alcohol dehydrogenase [Paenibacillus caseinilyticus]
MMVTGTALRSMNCVFTGPNEVEWREEEVRQPGPRDLLCRAVVSLISPGTELACLKGTFDSGTGWASWVQYPFHPGYSMTAEVLWAGPEVVGIRAGDRIVCQERHRQLFVIDSREASRLPETVSEEEGTFVQLAKVALLGVLRGKTRLGERAGVVGLGLLGQLVIQFLALSGARSITAISPSSNRLALARLSGATDLIPEEAQEAIGRVKEQSGGRMLDTVYEVTGNPEVLSCCTMMAKEFGKVVLLGDTTQTSRQTVGPKVVFNAVSIIGVHGRLIDGYEGWTEREREELIFNWMHRKKLRMNHLITDSVHPLEAGAAYERLSAKGTEEMGVLIDWTRL